MVAHAAQPWSTPSYRCLSPPSLPACNCCWCALIIHFIIVLTFYLLNANRRAYAPLLPPSTACLLPLPPPPPSSVMLFLGVAWLVLFLLLGLGKCFAQIVNGLVSFCSNKWNQCHAPFSSFCSSLCWNYMLHSTACGVSVATKDLGNELAWKADEQSRNCDHCLLPPSCCC